MSEESTSSTDITDSTSSLNSESSSSSSRSSFSSRSTSSRSSMSRSSVSSVSSSVTMSYSSCSSQTGTLSSESSSSRSSRSSSSSVSSSSNSSVSSISSSVSTASSLSSHSSQSSSSSSSSSSKSSSSTVQMTSSSSSSTVRFSSSSSESSVSSVSSSSSGYHGATSLAFRVESFLESPVWCFASRQGDDDSSSDSEGTRTIYAGTGPNGIVLKSTDLSTWTTFTTVDDCHVKSMFVWANALFMGTQPKGRIYVHNFESGEEYLFVETEDEVVTSFAEYQGKLYAGTSPAGIIYSFDGLVWKEEHRPYGNGVSAMAASNAGLFVFSNGAEGPVVFDGTSWKAFFATKTEQSITTKGITVSSQRNVKTEQSITTKGITVSSQRNVKEEIYGRSGETPIVRSKFVTADMDNFSKEDANEISPSLPQFNVAAAVQTSNGVAFGGLDNGTVLLASNGDLSITKLFDIGSPIEVLSYISSNCMMASSGGTIFLAKGAT